jgi:hypothetical protein
MDASLGTDLALWFPIPSLLYMNPWVACSDRLPPIRTRVLVFSPEKYPDKTVLHVNEAMRVDIPGGWTWDHGVPPAYVTHWGHVHEVIKCYPEVY